MKVFLWIALLFSAFIQSDAWFICIKRKCEWSNWGSWSGCNGGIQTRTRRVTKAAKCGGSCSGDTESTRYCNVGSIKFYTLQSGTKLRGSEQPYSAITVSNIPSTYLNRGSKIRFVIHGWLESPLKSRINNLAHQLYLNGDPVIIVDWSVYSGLGKGLPYVDSCVKTEKVGDTVADFIRALEGRGYRRANMHLVGFSLGGKVSARAGEKLAGQLGRITGLDTPLYCVPSGIPTVGLKGPELTPSKALFVDTIRTTFLSGLFFQQQGDADFHVGCDGCRCDKTPLDTKAQHAEAVHLFMRSVRDSDCRTVVQESCNCILGIIKQCQNNGNTLGLTATKPSGRRMYLIPNSRVPGKCKRNL